MDICEGILGEMLSLRYNNPDFLFIFFFYSPPWYSLGLMGQASLR